MERMWFYLHENQQKGPIKQDELISLLQQAILPADTQIWTEGMPDWQPASATSLTAQYAQPSAGRPTAVTVFGIINIVFGGLGLLSIPLVVVAMLIPKAGGTAIAPSQSMQMFLFLSYGVRLVLSCVLLAGGIGLLNRRNWARQITYCYGWFTIAWVVFSVTASIIIANLTPAATGSEARFAAMAGVVGGVCGGIIGSIYPIFAVVYMRKPHIIAACNR
ncbi:MAG: DUF4339 domain-containing protein [Planctomycetaceae bacterium]|nr:DUF4339 domain-containing protein [Planctomycetaceae bacterium]